MVFLNSLNLFLTLAIVCTIHIEVKPLLEFPHFTSPVDNSTKHFSVSDFSLHIQKEVGNRSLCKSTPTLLSWISHLKSPFRWKISAIKVLLELEYNSFISWTLPICLENKTDCHDIAKFVATPFYVWSQSRSQNHPACKVLIKLVVTAMQSVLLATESVWSACRSLQLDLMVFG